MINLGNKNISEIYVGDKNITDVYIGDKNVYSSISYTPVKYLVNSASKQWIDTLVVPSLNLKAEIGISTPTPNDDFYISCRKDSGNTRYYVLNANWQYGFVTTKGAWQATPMAYIKPSDYTALNEIVSEIYETEIWLQVNTKRESKANTYNDMPTWTLPLFGGKINRDAFTNASPAGTKFYYVRFYENSKLTRDFVPALDTNGKPAMFDKVSKTFFYNLGAGEFGYETMDGTYVAPV